MATSTPVIAVDPRQFVDQKRRATRHSLDSNALLMTDSAPFSNAGQEVWVFDFSLAGIGFRSKKAVPLASTHRIRLQTRTLRLDTRIRISRCDKRDVGYDIGAVFIEE